MYIRREVARRLHNFSNETLASNETKRTHNRDVFHEFFFSVEKRLIIFAGNSIGRLFFRIPHSTLLLFRWNEKAQKKKNCRALFISAKWKGSLTIFKISKIKSKPVLNIVTRRNSGARWTRRVFILWNFSFQLKITPALD